MLRKIDRVILRMPSLESAIRHYRDVLGMKLLRREKALACFSLEDGGELVLHDDPDLPFEEVYYLVEDVRDLYERREALHLKFVSPPARVSRGYKAVIRDPFGTVLRILDRRGEDSSTAIEDARPAGGLLFAGVEPHIPTKKEALIAAYERIGRTADDLPYTPHFETIYNDYAAHHPEARPTRQEVWRHLLNLRKGGKLPRLGEARTMPPEISPEARQQLRDMLGEDIGKRDRLPYTPRFDQIVDAFNKTRPRPLSPHLVWRLVATLAK